MTSHHSFRFANDKLNQNLIKLLTRRAKGRFRLDRKGFVHYSHDDEDLINNDLISNIRASVFPEWKVLTFPAEWADSYRQYMAQRGIPFQEEVRDNKIRFLVERSRRSEEWDLAPPVSNR